MREASAIDVPGAQGPACLIFDGGTVCRRVWRYPPLWLELSDAAVLALMDHPR